MPLQATSGAASYDAFGGGVAVVPNYIEDVFSTWLYTGNGSTQTITNGVDLAGKGGLVWAKGRTTLDGPAWNILVDTARGVSKNLSSNATNAQFTASTVTSFNANGFALGDPFEVNQNAASYVSWTFREQPKFFDVVTYTGNNTAGRTVAHSLGSEPGCIIVKATVNGAFGAGAYPWQVYHRSTDAGMGPNKFMSLNSTAGESTGSDRWNNTAPTSTVFTLGNAPEVNESGVTYVAYLFAHDAGGFGLTGTDNVISCGIYTGNGSATGPVVSLGYEPQWLMVKNASGTGNWNIIDNMRGMPVGSADAYLEANTADAEATADWVSPTATGFQITSTSSEVNTNASTYIYIAIRRGPMKVPTTGTSVFYADNTATNGSTVTTGFPVDMTIWNVKWGYTGNSVVNDRLRGVSSNSSYAGPELQTASTNAEGAISQPTLNWGNTGYTCTTNDSIQWAFRRAPSFFDEVCYTGTGSATTQTHNLGVVPELMIVKNRTTAGTAWTCYASTLGASGYIDLNSNNASSSSANIWNSTLPTASVFSVGIAGRTNESAANLVAYLFASCPGVSKVGSYTGTGATQVINCGFTGGARFVLIKATTSTTGDWLVWDSARGIVAGNDPYLALNSTAAEVTNTDWVDTAATGFELSNAGGNLANSSGVSYIFLAIA